MTTFMMIRHGHCDPVGKYIAGRKEGIHLTEKGKKQVLKLIDKLKNIEIAAVFSSPLERTVETATEICKSKHMDFSISEKLQEIDYGLWTGKSFEQLLKDPLWDRFNMKKAEIRIPGGEMIIEVAKRMSCLIEKLRNLYMGVVILVSHGDPIKSVIAHYSGIPLNNISRFDVQPASISTFTIDDYGVRLLTLNDSSD